MSKIISYNDLRSLRLYKKLGQRELASNAKVSLRELSQCERGLTLPDSDFFVAIAGTLGVDANELIEMQRKKARELTPGEGYTTAVASEHHILIRRKEPNRSSIKIVDLFCGVGGFSHGFEHAGGFEVTAGLDLLSDRVTTFAQNHPTATVFCADIHNVSPDEIADVAMSPDVVIGGPPCQGFSSLRPFRTLTEGDNRNNLYEQFVLNVDKLRPKWFVMENVVGLLTHKDGETLRTISSLFEQAGYSASWRVLNAALYGLPQRRERLIIVGNREGKVFNWPEPTHCYNGRSMAGRHGQMPTSVSLFDELVPAVTVMEAIHDLPPVRSGESADVYRSDVTPTGYELLMRGTQKKVSLHEATRHSQQMLEIIRVAGHNRSALPEGMTTSGFSSSYSRLEADRPSVTLTVNFVHPASNKCIHPHQDRALTPREGARLQSFDDAFDFVGSRAQIVKQIGNAVPPLLGEVIAKALLAQF